MNEAVSDTERNSCATSYVTAYNLCRMFKLMAKRDCEDMLIILAADFNVNVKDN
jgi:hypothetical protein